MKVFFENLIEIYEEYESLIIFFIVVFCYISAIVAPYIGLRASIIILLGIILMKSRRITFHIEMIWHQLEIKNMHSDNHGMIITSMMNKIEHIESILRNKKN